LVADARKDVAPCTYMIMIVSTRCCRQIALSWFLKWEVETPVLLESNAVRVSFLKSSTA
jgi:hypothetical protein